MESPLQGVLQSLKELHVDENQIGDNGCTAFIAALQDGAMPAIKVIDLCRNPASEPAVAAVGAARHGLFVDVEMMPDWNYGNN